MTPETDPRLHRLLVRYWDGTLSSAEWAELDRQLRSDPTAQDQFQQFLVEAVTVADGVGLSPAARSDVLVPASRSYGRRWRVGLGLAVAAVVVLAIGIGGDFGEPISAPGAAVIIDCSPGVRIQTARGMRLAKSGTAVFNGESLLVNGMAESAEVINSDGTALMLAGETKLTLADTPSLRQVMLQGGAIRARVADSAVQPGFAFVTDEFRVVAEPGTALMLSRVFGRSEIEVVAGIARLFRRDGRSLPNATTGEVVSMNHDGHFDRQGSHKAPEQYRWDLSQPLPAGWEAGRIEPSPTAEPFGRSLAPSFWYDPYHGRHCWQIRSAKSWSSGLFRFTPDTSFRVRYRVERPGAGQLLAVIRPEPSSSAGKPTTDDPRTSFVMLAPIDFTPAEDGGWRTAEFAGSDWIPEQDAPDLSRPMMAFLVVFNTYDVDLGLSVADFFVGRASPPFLPEP